ncbi:MAG: tripartite tricarboxylate transporter substrate binding protein, partial [Pigmentiphaga sp.]
NKIAADVLEAASQPALQERYITGVGLVFANQGAAEFAAFLEKDRKKYAEKIQASGVKLDY